MRSIEVCFSPKLIHLHEVKGKLVVVVDIFRATSTMVAALAHGVTEILPFADLEACREMQKQEYLIAGERNGLTAPGFELGNSPLAFTNGKYAGRKLAMTTTNGTLAIEKSKGAAEILVGAFPNFQATANYIRSRNLDVVIHCAGWKGRFNLEDSLFAGALAQELADSHTNADDGALAMISLFSKEGPQLSSFLAQASHAKRLQNHGIEADIDFCLSSNLYTQVVGADKKGAMVVF
ncbi:MAG: 2-phosphosulfolactate phosphatase [Bacteroidetes bacterium]|nr:2-phosphosulfolactate phosphatase [Bacteroidota bacterium]MDA1269189.1 2-phosphosulfolactate phosphatase [Bacteroidota bacterium]